MASKINGECYMYVKNILMVLKTTGKIFPTEEKSSNFRKVYVVFKLMQQ